MSYYDYFSREEISEVEQNVEEEPKELTLDEWKAQRAGRVKPQYNIRKAGEGEDPSQWKKMFELRKKEKEEVDNFHVRICFNLHNLINNKNIGHLIFN